MNEGWKLKFHNFSHVVLGLLRLQSEVLWRMSFSSYTKGWSCMHSFMKGFHCSSQLLELRDAFSCLCVKW